MEIEYEPQRIDFWNDPMLWLGISDPYSQMCWMTRTLNYDLKPPSGPRQSLEDGWTTYNADKSLEINKTGEKWMLRKRRAY